MKNNQNIHQSISQMTNVDQKYWKRKLLFTLVVVMFFVTSGCKKFLDKEPTFIVKENYYNNENDVNAGLAGVYDVLGKEEIYGGNFQLLLAVADDGFYSRSAYTFGPAVYNFDAADASVANFWKYLYEGIERANIFLSKVDGVNMPQAAKDAAKGEVKFLRAYYYFLLVDNWGNVPLKITPTASVNDVNIKATPQREIYNFITKEMEEAEAMVKTATTIGFGGKISKSTVRGILARVYLKMAGAPLKDQSKYAEALKWARKIVYPDAGAKEHRLLPSYQQIFTNYAGDKYDVGETIWEVELYGNRGGDFESGRVGNTFGLQCNDEVHGYSYGLVNTTKKLFDSYENQDVRKNWAIAPYAYTYSTVNTLITVTDSLNWTAAQIYNRNVGKFRRAYEKLKPKNKNYTPQNFPLLRYADVLLMLAEAENEVNGPSSLAKQALKEVRTRANATDVTLTISSYEDMKAAIRKERYLELSFESLRKFDLIRWDIFVSEMNQLGTAIQGDAGATWSFGAMAGKNVTSRNNLLPIPVLELSLNKGLSQNTGW